MTDRTKDTGAEFYRDNSNYVPDRAIVPHPAAAPIALPKDIRETVAEIDAQLAKQVESLSAIADESKRALQAVQTEQTTNLAQAVNVAALGTPLPPNPAFQTFNALGQPVDAFGRPIGTVLP